MGYNLKYSIFAVVICIFCFVYENIKSRKLDKQILYPLSPGIKKWTYQSRLINWNKVKDKLPAYFYAYSILTLEELNLLQVKLKSYDNNSIFLTTFSDLFMKLILPFTTFVFGLIIAISNNLLAIISKSEIGTENQMNNVTNLFKEAFESYSPYGIIVLLIFILIIINSIFKNDRNNQLNQHLLIIEKAIENRKGIVKYNYEGENN